MSKYYRNRPLKVLCVSRALPAAIKDDEGAVERKVEAILESWRDTGRWWEGESEKAFFRLKLDGGGIKEVYQDLESQAWYLYKSYD